MGALIAWVEPVLLGLRAWWGRSAAIRHLDALATVLHARGYRCVARYRARPRLAVIGPRDRARAVVAVHAAPGGTWGYHEPSHHYLCPCGDAEGAAELVDHILKRRMFTASW
ncbi:hypothetical protein [Actinomadura sediminis]|uniref:Uncharacterized protein n=1 Tax=Actinomadura sediminis TaxID=1038904 RepID=A0ABW3ENX8_9ACTN